jgi:hypothetical protein
MVFSVSIFRTSFMISSKTVPWFLASALALALVGASRLDAGDPQVQFPATFNLSVGKGAPTPDESASQDIPAQQGTQLYFQVNSPFGVVLNIYSKTDSGKRGDLIGSMKGTSFGSSINPQDGVLQFSIAPEDKSNGGNVTFLISDGPLMPAF